MEMFAKCRVVVFAQLFHSPLHSLLKLHNGLVTIVKNLFIIKLHSHIHNFKYLVLSHEKFNEKQKEQGDTIENENDCIMRG
jgi:hypothetical protein